MSPSKTLPSLADFTWAQIAGAGGVVFCLGALSGGFIGVIVGLAL